MPAPDIPPRNCENPVLLGASWLQENSPHPFHQARRPSGWKSIAFNGFFKGALSVDVAGSISAAQASSSSRGVVRFLLAVPVRSHVRIAVYDVSGRELAVLADRDYTAGRHDVTWDSSGRVSSGIYFIRATGPGKNQVQRISVTR